MIADGPILVGYDGTDRGKDALELARRLARPLHSHVDVLSILSYVPAVEVGDYESMLREDERRLAAEARLALEGADVATWMIPSASPSRELHDFADSHDAGIVVVGSTHRGPIGRVFPGSVADRLLAAGPCSVAIAPVDYRNSHEEIGSIAVALDGSGQARAALAAAYELALRLNASVELVAVASAREAVPVLPLPGAQAGAMVRATAIANAESRARQALDAGLALCPYGVMVGENLVLEANPARGIVDACQDADLLMMGSRAYGPLGKVILGSVSAEVVREVSCPVLITPRPLSLTPSE